MACTVREEEEVLVVKAMAAADGVVDLTDSNVIGLEALVEVGLEDFGGEAAVCG